MLIPIAHAAYQVSNSNTRCRTKQVFRIKRGSQTRKNVISVEYIHVFM